MGWEGHRYRYQYPGVTGKQSPLNLHCQPKDQKFFVSRVQNTTKQQCHQQLHHQRQMGKTMPIIQVHFSGVQESSGCLVTLELLAFSIFTKNKNRNVHVVIFKQPIRREFSTWNALTQCIQVLSNERVCHLLANKLESSVFKRKYWGRCRWDRTQSHPTCIPRWMRQ